MVETSTRVETQTEAPYRIQMLDLPSPGVNYPSWDLRRGLVLDTRLAMRFVGAGRTLTLGLFQFQDGELVPKERVADLKYSRNHELAYPDGWKIEIRGFFRSSGLFVCLASIEDKLVRTPQEAGIKLPEFWESRRY